MPEPPGNRSSNVEHRGLEISFTIQTARTQFSRMLYTSPGTPYSVRQAKLAPVAPAREPQRRLE